MSDLIEILRDGTNRCTERQATCMEAADRIEALEAELKQMRKKVVHCNNCGDDWVDNGLVRVTCPHCELGQAKATIEAVRVFPTEIGLTWSGAEVQAWLSKRLANAGEQERKNEDE